jgi:prepilin-type N-terminal cleavage/methylation domain-containing protein
MKITPRTGKAAFTLIELMAVITIIVILAGLVVGGMGFVSERQAKEKAKVQIALLSKALEEYKLDMGSYPPTVDKPNVASPAGTGTSAVSLYDALFYDGYDYGKQATPPTTWTKAVKIYLADLDPTSTKQGWVTTSTTTVGKSLTVSDPWGNQYCYRTAVDSTGKANASTQNPDFDLWSMGKDGKSKPATPSDTTNRDDIKNF